MRETLATWSPSRANVRRAEKRKSGLYAGINVVGFLSVQVALLAIFLNITPDATLRPPVDLPATNNATPQHAALREDSMRLIVERDGKTYFGDDAADPEKLPGLIRAAVGKGSEKTVYLLADERAQYADVRAALDAVRRAGIRNVVVLSEDQHSQ
ncbi:MAG TPA: biopolymer transporter ExbD [Candidatus Baltobacteraceae bacterium]|nr:biopolymer transporter ExbD [Candidatus Baltobacteraceae bacterium]